MRAAKAALVDWDMLRSKKYQEQQWRALRIGAHPNIILFTRLMVGKCAKLGIPMFASEIVRTPARQAQLKADGFSRVDGAKAPHPYGCAVDIVHSVRGWSLTPKQWEMIGALGKAIAIQRALHVTWGGDWPPKKDNVGWDPAHWQLTGWRKEMSGFPFMPSTFERRKQ